MERPTKLCKFDKKGNYTRYPGLTFISMLSENDKASLSEFYIWVTTTRTTFCKYYSMLPPSSYHATIKNHKVASPRPLELWFEDFINNFAINQQMKEVCTQFPSSSIPAKATSPYVRKTFGVDLVFADEMMPEIEKLRSNLVNLGSKPEPGFKYHMTLAYRFKTPASESETEALTQDAQVVLCKLREVLSKTDFGLKFEKPKFCYFDHMGFYDPL